VRKISPAVVTWKWDDLKTDVEGAMRVTIGVWRSSRWLRCLYPTPFTHTDGGGFHRWMQWQISWRFRGDSSARANLDAAFLRKPHDSICDYYLHDYRLRLKHPLGLISEGRVNFAKWLLNHGLHRFGGTAVDVLWFLNAAESDEEPFVKLTRAISPSWQADAASAPERLQSKVRSINFDSKEVPGVTLIGHFTFCSGLQRSAMLSVEALKRLGENVSLRNIPVLEGRDINLKGLDFLGEEIHDLSLLHVTPDPFYLKAYEHAGLHARRQSRRMAHYAWELQALPPSAEPIPDLREIWVYSQFVSDSLRDWNLPTHVILPPMQRPDEPPPRSINSMRQRLGIDPDEFVFLFIFDVSSTLERKNPTAVIEAFRRAVRKSDKARLILKAARTQKFSVSFAPVAQMAHEAGVTVLTEMLSDTDTQLLIAACDCYVSLHRSEGFGFTLAEAMLLGKPVIATGYSGNLDFMNEQNSYLVDWAPGEVPKGTLAYPAGFHWADPDVEHAADCMRKVLDERDDAQTKGLRAMADCERLFDPEKIARQISDRLKALRA
jgi:glycosyltransferase involved in cell wall biosynthesis